MTDIGKNYGIFSRNAADLCGFMLVCEHGKLSAAAKVLKITQPSLSQRIKNLELTLGQQLFVRQSTGVTMTPAGLALHHSLSASFGALVTQFGEFLDQPKTDRVVLSVDHAFASFWLLERLPQLREELGQTDICIITSQDPLKPQGADPDITIYMSNQEQADPGSTLLFNEDVCAICSPFFLAKHPELQTPADLLDPAVPLLHLNAPTLETPWLSWGGWLRGLGIAVNHGVPQTVFNTYEMVMRAAKGGQGVALGWRVLVDPLLEDGQIVELMPHHVQTNVGYFARLAANPKTPKAHEVQKWIIAQTAQAH